MTKSLILLTVILGLLTSCVSKSELEKANAEITKLKKRIDELENGAERTIAKIEQNLKSKSYQQAKTLILKLKKDHPESSSKYDKKLPWLDKKLVQEEKERKRKQRLAEIKRKKEAEAERVRKNRNNTGMWHVSYYVDDFGKPTKSGYIRTKKSVFGSFSNSATQNSKLKIEFLLSKYEDADIQLYEYAGRNPVKGYMNRDFKVLVQDKNGKRYKLDATLWKGSDRLSLSKNSSKKLHSILKKGGQVQFRIKQNNSLNEYSFALANTDWYYNAYKKLHKIE